MAALAGDAAVVDLLLSNQTETTNTATQQSFVAIVPPQTASADVFLTIASGNDSYLSAKNPVEKGTDGRQMLYRNCHCEETGVGGGQQRYYALDTGGAVTILTQSCNKKKTHV